MGCNPTGPDWILAPLIEFLKNIDQILLTVHYFCRSEKMAITGMNAEHICKSFVTNFLNCLVV